MVDPVFVQRDAGGKIVGLYAVAQPGYAEEVAAGDAAEVQAFRASLVAPAAPVTVTPRQARLALLGAGLLDQVNAAVAAAGGATAITWEFATQINRTDPLISTLAVALKLSDAQIDALFAQAVTL